MFASATTSNQNTIEDWKLLFASLLKAQAQPLDFSLEFNNGSLIFNTPDAKLAEDLEKILKSPETVLTNIDYTLQKVKSGAEPATVPPIPLVQYPKQIELADGIGEIFFTSLFNANLRQKIGIAWNTENKKDNNHILEASCDPDFIEVTQAQINMFRQILAKASFDQLRQAIAADKNEQKPLEKQEKEDGPIAPFVDKILYLSSDHTKIYFDFGLLVKCLTPPKVEPLVPAGATNSTDVNFVFRIDPQHLMNYLSIIFQEGFILHISGDKAKPICFNMERAIPRKQSVSLVIDCSGSMAPDEAPLKENVINFVNGMANNPQFDDTEIRITHFSDATSETAVFNLKEAEVITNHVESLKMGTHTALHSTIHKVLSKLEPELNTTVVIFTDGVDSGSMPLEQLELLTNTLIKETTNPPKIFTLGLGHKYNFDLLNELAKSTGCQHIKLETMEDFKNIFQYLDTMSVSRRLVRILQESAKLAFIFPAKEGCLTVSPTTVAFPGRFIVNGREYHTERGGRQLLVASDNNAATEIAPQPVSVTSEPSSAATPNATTTDVPANAASLIAQFGVRPRTPDARLEENATSQSSNALSTVPPKGGWCSIQ